MKHFYIQFFLLVSLLSLSGSLLGQSITPANPTTDGGIDGSISVESMGYKTEEVYLYNYVSGYDDSDYSNSTYLQTGSSFPYKFSSLEDGDYVVVFLYYIKGKGKGNKGSWYYTISHVILTDVALTDYYDSNGAGVFDWGITKVIFNEINNSSDTDDESGFEDFTSIETTVLIGESYDLSVYLNTEGKNTLYAVAWIDWNGNKSFNDDGERYDLGSTRKKSDGITSNSPVSILVPASANAGSTIMRVSAKYDSYPYSSETDFYGEVEDYTLNIISNTTGNPPNATCKDITVQLDASGNASITADDINNNSSDVETADDDLLLSIDKDAFDCDDKGSQTVTLTVEDGDGNTSECTATVTVEDNIAPSLLNLNAEYYTTISFGELKYSESVDEVDYSWGNGYPATNLVGTDYFSIRFSGSFVAPIDGDYTFYTNSDDGVRLKIDGSYLINNWGNHASTVNEGTRSLSEGEHTITLEYYENTGGAVIELEWESSDAGIAKDVFSKSSILNNTIVETTLKLDDSGNATLAAADVDPGFIDNCGDITQTLSQSSFSSADIGENTVVLTVKDASGNSTTFNVEVTVESADPTVTLSVGSNSIDENGGNTLITAQIPSAYTDDITVNLTYSGGSSSDYSSANQIVIPAGSTSVSINFTAVDNDTYDGDLDVLVEVSTVTHGIENGTQEQTITIEDDEAPSEESIEVDDQSPEKAYTADELVQNVLVTGCLVASNVIYSGDETNGLGYFNAGDSDFPLSSGIIISTGKVEKAEGPNSSGSTSNNIGGVSGDSDVKALTSNNGYDAQILEFDFVPAGDVLEFNYIFASEEYPEYVGRGFNDVFAFILSGPGIDGDYQDNGENIALIPGTTQSVSINNVNASTNSAYYEDGTGAFDTEFDGKTTILTATADVEACETYHIRLIISDVSDSKWNSAVFIEANSFKTNEVVVDNMIGSIEGNQDVMYEGCDGSFMRFNRAAGYDLDERIEILMNIAGTASNETGSTQDYIYVNASGDIIGDGVFPSTIVIPSGDEYADYYYEALSDDAVENDETIIFRVDRCPCEESDVYEKIVTIINSPEVEAVASAAIQCEGAGNPTATITVQLVDGISSANYLYSFDGGTTFDIDNVYSITSAYADGRDLVGKTFDIVVKDLFSCSDNTLSLTTTIPEIESISADAGGPYEVCAGTEIQLIGQGGIYFEWSCDKAEGLAALDDQYISNPTVSKDIPSDTYVFTLLVQDQPGSSAVCSDQETVILKVLPTPSISSLTADEYELCSGEETSLHADVDMLVTYVWNPSTDLDDGSIASPTFSADVSVKESISYTLKVTASNGCSAERNLDEDLTVYPNPAISLISASSNLCTDGTNGEIQIDVTGGTLDVSSSYDYEWSHNSSLNSSIATGLGADNYTVTVTDSKSCSVSETFNVTAQPKPIGIFFK